MEGGIIDEKINDTGDGSSISMNGDEQKTEVVEEHQDKEHTNIPIETTVDAGGDIIVDDNIENDIGVATTAISEDTAVDEQLQDDVEVEPPSVLEHNEQPDIATTTDVQNDNNGSAGKDGGVDTQETSSYQGEDTINNATTPTPPHKDETLENVSDISDPSCEEDDDNWAQDGEENMDNFDATDPRYHQEQVQRRSFTIANVIASSDHHGSIRSQRENVDRLLMSGLTGGDMSQHGGGSSLGGISEGSPQHLPARHLRSPGQQHYYPPASYTYSQNYYRNAGDWLRFVPRRSSGREHMSNTSSSDHDPTSNIPSLSDEGQQHHHPNYHHRGDSPNYDTPDMYYRGFDNTRIRTGFYRNPGATSTRVRHPTDDSQHQLNYPLQHQQLNFPPQVAQQHFHQGTGGPPILTMVGPNGELIAVEQSFPEGYPHHQYPMPPMVPQVSMTTGSTTSSGHHIHPTYMYPNVMSAPIDEEEGGAGERDVNNNVEVVGQKIRKDNSTPPLEIHCSPNFDTRVESSSQVGGPQDIQSLNQVPTHQEEIMRGTPSPPPRSGSPPQQFPPPPPDGEEVQFESSLRIGGIVRPPSRSHTSTTQSASRLPPHILEQKMHEASWDSKFETYACRVDQNQEDRSVEIPIFTMSRPHMRAFHYAWFTFFFCFLAWFAITPLLAEVQNSLGLSHEQLWTSSICAVAGALVTRPLTGMFCDIYGARWMSAVVLFVCGFPTMFTGLVNSSVGLSMLRLVTGIGGSAFVTCQYWTSTMFTREVAGTANAIAAGWGNLGGAVAQIFVGSMLFPMFKAIYSAAGTETDPAELSWRSCCVIPGLICTVFTYFVYKYADDSPKGNYTKRKSLGLMQKPSAMKHIKTALRDHNTWLLLIQYGCCFGVEITTTNAAALYFHQEFELSIESAAAVASIFGWMNLFARGLGGFLSDISNAYRGMRGRLVWQLISFLLEGKYVIRARFPISHIVSYLNILLYLPTGIFIIVFSKALTLGGAICAIIIFSLFVQASEGSTFGIVPYLNVGVTGTVSGIVGAGGNAGAVIFSILFRQLVDYRAAFFWMGVSTAVMSLLSSFVWIRGYEGLFFKRRVFP